MWLSAGDMKLDVVKKDGSGRDRGGVSKVERAGVRWVGRMSLGEEK